MWGVGRGPKCMTGGCFINGTLQGAYQFTRGRGAMWYEINTWGVIYNVQNIEYSRSMGLLNGIFGVGGNNC